MPPESTNYLLSADRIGTGSSCDVYRGVHKVTFAVVAVKVLKDHSWRKEIEKEVAALVQLESHRNIVKFFGKEFETTRKLPCLVVEYCDQGSLHSVLKEVENKHGLSDSEFLSLLKDITNGLEHLQKNGCIHRDIKPGNILKSSRSDGKSTYKLSDFGASRMSSGKDEGFYSLAGTEEYLHPDMYEKAFINRRLSSRFDHRADMWSLGCTLYQAITGEMPYKPFDGARNNRSVMFQMVGRKPNGVIAGYQNSSDGEIIWLYTLPTDCNMTCDLRRHLLPILVGLMELGKKQWTFDTYKTAVRAVLSLKLVFVLDSEDISMFHLYIEPQKSLAEFQERVSFYTDIHSDHQKMYYNQISFPYFLREDATVDTFPVTDINNPVFVISTQLTEYHSNNKFSLEPYDSFRNHTMSTITDDIQVAGNQCQTIHQIHSKMVNAKAIILGLNKMTLTLWKRNLDRCKFLQSKNRQWHEWFKGIISTANPRNGERHTIQNINQQTSKFSHSIESLVSFENMADTPEVLVDDWCSVVKDDFAKSKDLMNRMHHRKQEVLTDYEHAEHEADKALLQEITARCVDLWQTRCAAQMKKSIREFVKAKSIYKEKITKLIKLERELKDFHKRGMQIMNAIGSREALKQQQQTKPLEYSIKKMSSSDGAVVRRLLNEVRAAGQSVCEQLATLPELVRLDTDDGIEMEDGREDDNRIITESTRKETTQNFTKSKKDIPDFGSRYILPTSKSNVGDQIMKTSGESGFFTGISKSS